MTSRHPRVGDMLIYNYKSILPCVGVVDRVEYDRFIHGNHVHVHWQSRSPSHYSHKYGFASINIHNMRHEFKVIREGIEVW